MTGLHLLLKSANAYWAWAVGCNWKASCREIRPHCSWALNDKAIVRGGLRLARPIAVRFRPLARLGLETASPGTRPQARRVPSLLLQELAATMHLWGSARRPLPLGRPRRRARLLKSWRGATSCLRASCHGRSRGRDGHSIPRASRRGTAPEGRIRDRALKGGRDAPLEHRDRADFILRMELGRDISQPSLSFLTPGTANI